MDMRRENILQAIHDEIIEYYNTNNISFSLKEYYDTHLLMTDYFEILRKKITPKCRKVLISKELKIKSESPDFKEWLPRFQELKKWFESGKDMNGFLSKKHKDSDFRDRLLTCWNTHHIHFFPEKKKGDMLLFVVIKDDTVYFVDVLPHSKKYVFYTYNLLNIISDNWQFLFEPYLIKEATGVSERITNDKDIQALRNAGACTIVEIRGKVYCLDMMMSSGHSSSDVILSDNVCNTIGLNIKKNIFVRCQIEKVFLTGYHRPCFIILYRNDRKDLCPWVLG